MDENTIYPLMMNPIKGGEKWINPRTEEERFNFLESSYSGKGGYSTGEYLIPHAREDAFSFGARKAKARIINDFKTIIDGHIAPIFSADPIVQYAENIPQNILEKLAIFESDCDGSGTPFRIFMKNFARAARKFDSAFVFVDVLSKEQQSNSARGDVPTLELFIPSRIKSIKMNGNQKVLEVEWVAIKPESFENTASMRSGKMSFSSGGSFTFSSSDNTEIIDQGDNGLGYIPFVALYPEGNDNSIDDPLPYGLAYTLATIQHRRFNLASIIDEQSDNQAFSILCIPSIDQDITIGVGNALTGCPEQGNMPAYISPDASQLETLSKQLESMTNEMFRVGNMPQLMSFPQTAEAKKIDLERQKSALKDFQQQIKQADSKIMRIVSDYLGYDVGYKVQYSSEFADEDIDSIIEQVQGMDNANFTPSLISEMEKKAARILTHGNEEGYQELVHKIEEHRLNMSQNL